MGGVSIGNTITAGDGARLATAQGNQAKFKAQAEVIKSEIRVNSKAASITAGVASGVGAEREKQK